jgi:hypothetical protein
MRVIYWFNIFLIKIGKVLTIDKESSEIIKLDNNGKKKLLRKITKFFLK